VANSATQTGGTTKAKDNVMPAPTAGVAKDADARTAAKAEKREKRAAKKARNQAARDTAATSKAAPRALRRRHQVRDHKRRPNQGTPHA
jgi:hypothetical protein